MDLVLKPHNKLEKEIILRLCNNNLKPDSLSPPKNRRDNHKIKKNNNKKKKIGKIIIDIKEDMDCEYSFTVNILNNSQIQKSPFSVSYTQVPTENESLNWNEFKNVSKISPMDLPKSFYNSSPSDFKLDANACKNINASKFSFFVNLQRVLIKLFSKQPITCEEMNLENYEMSVLKAILRKKKLLENINLDLDWIAFNNLMKVNLKKQKDYNLKFIILRSLNHLKKKFIEDRKQQNKDSQTYTPQLLLHSEINFYLHYFKEISVKENIPIENFFAFKNRRHKFNNNIPKSITSKSLALWKKNPLFISEIKNYLRKKFLGDFIEFNRGKIDKWIFKWEKQAREYGLENTVCSVLKSLDQKGTKLPWTTCEVNHGIKVTLNSLD